MVENDAVVGPATRSSTPMRLLLGVALAAAIVGVVGGLLAGSRRPQAPQHLHGIAYVGDHVATIKGEGWFYGIRGSVPWYDASGTFHEDGWPRCLDTVGTSVAVSFGAVTLTPPDNGSIYRSVVYLDCRGP
jgi:hypothetical protein